MTTRRISGPEAIAVPADVPGSHAANDTSVIAAIAAAQATIDGPGGWLNRAIGKQELELWLPRFQCSAIRLIKPVIDIVSISYLGPDEASQSVDDTAYYLVGDDLHFRTGFSEPDLADRPDAVRIRYRAGYEASGVPPQARKAVVLMTANLLMVASEKIQLKSEEVEGVGRTDYTMFQQASDLVDKAVSGLLSGLRVYQ